MWKCSILLNDLELLAVIFNSKCVNFQATINKSMHLRFSVCRSSETGTTCRRATEILLLKNFPRTSYIKGKTNQACIISDPWAYVACQELSLTHHNAPVNRLLWTAFLHLLKCLAGMMLSLLKVRTHGDVLALRHRLTLKSRMIFPLGYLWQYFSSPWDKCTGV